MDLAERNKHLKSFKRLDIVRVKDDVTSQLSEPAMITSTYWDIKGGVRLDRLIFGFHSWNVDNLVKVEGVTALPVSA
jgi:hypothetical protein